MSNATDSDGGGPFEEQRAIYELLSQETRHLVLQYILAHPEHLLSLDELDYLIPKNKAAIRDQVQRLREEGVVERYEYPPNEDSRDLPSQFYGLTEYGVAVLDEYNYLRGLPVARALYDNTRLSTKAERHRDAPRPPLPETVDQALRIDDSDESLEFERLVSYIRDRKENTASLDAQIAVAKAFPRHDIGPDDDGLKRSEINEELDVDIQYQLRTVLDHLVEIDILEQVEPAGPDVFAISERLDDIVNGRVQDEAERNIEALVRHIDDELQAVQLEEEAAEWDEQDTAVTAPSVALADGAGRSIRSILAAEFDVAPEHVADYLRSGDPVDRLNTTVEAIESSEEVTKSEDYGRILFVSPAYRYRLSQTAVELL
jgi:DNA-binding HxlR family transcriptional regulator